MLYIWITYPIYTTLFLCLESYYSRLENYACYLFQCQSQISFCSKGFSGYVYLIHLLPCFPIFVQLCFVFFPQCVLDESNYLVLIALDREFNVCERCQADILEIETLCESDIAIMSTSHLPLLMYFGLDLAGIKLFSKIISFLFLPLWVRLCKACFYRIKYT